MSPPSPPPPPEPALLFSSARERQVFWALFAVLSLVCLAPFWLVRYHPIVDLGCHLAAVSVWQHHDDPAWDYRRYYDLQLGAAPYWIYYALTRALSAVVGLDLANRLVLSAYALSVPGGLLVLGRRFDRSPWLSLFGFALIWNFNLLWGFVTLLCGMGLTFFAIAAFDRFCERPTLGRAALAVALGIATYFTHILTWGMYLAAAGMVGLLHQGRSLRRMAGRVLCWLPSALLGTWLTLYGTTLHTGRVRYGIRPVWQPVLRSLVEINERILDVLVGHEDERLAVLVLLSFVLLKLSQGRRLRPRSLHDLRAFGVFLVPCLAYFILPRSLLAPSYWWGINLRFATPAAILLGLCVAGPIRGWRRWLLAPAVVAGLGLALLTLRHWQAQNRFQAGLDQLAPLPEPGSRVLVIAFPPYWPEPEKAQYLRRAASSLYQIQRGGYNPHNFDEGFPLRYRERYPTPAWDAPETFNWDFVAPYYDYLLTFQANPTWLFYSHLKEVTEVRSAGRWTLWRLPGPRRDKPPAPPYPAYLMNYLNAPPK